MLHHEYPEALEDGDRARTSALFVSSNSDEASAATLELLEHFSRIENAMLVIERVNLEELPVRAEVWIQVEGEDRSGARQTVTQAKKLVLVEEDGSWKIQTG